MSKFSPRTRLPGAEERQLFIEFCQYLSELRSPVELAAAVGDLLTKQEVAMVAKRLKIATLLLAGARYGEIQRRLRTSQSTIARVNIWLQDSGDGFRLLYERGRKYRRAHREPGAVSREWRRIKRKYPMYFWPQNLLEEVLRQASAKQRQRMLAVLDRLERKGQLLEAHRPLQRLLTAPPPGRPKLSYSRV